MGFLGLLPLQVSAQDSDVRDDVRCLVVGSKFAGLGDAYKSAGMMITIYYFGRLDAHIPKLDVGDLVVKEATAMTPEDFRSEAKRCGNTFAVKGQELTQIGKDLIQRSQKMHQSSDSAK
jgi:hypothetical protein